MRRLELLPEAPIPARGGGGLGPRCLSGDPAPLTLAQVPGTPHGFSQGRGHAGRGASSPQAGLSNVTVRGWRTDKRRHGVPGGRVTGNVELLTLQENVAEPWNRVREGLGCEPVGHFRRLLLAVCLCPCVCLAGLCVYVSVRMSSSGPGRRGVIREPTDFGGARQTPFLAAPPHAQKRKPSAAVRRPALNRPRPGTPGALSRGEGGGLLEAATALLHGASRLWVRKGTTCLSGRARPVRC